LGKKRSGREPSGCAAENPDAAARKNPIARRIESSRKELPWRERSCLGEE
jgi:hypothetical protein